jgi:hypothetical protein
MSLSDDHTNTDVLYSVNENNITETICDKMQPVKHSSIELKRTDLKSDASVDTKCPKCQSTVTKTEQVMRKYCFNITIIVGR